ncbi:CHAD domain-containing protein [Amycolatopsis sp. NPDC059657]|uniref:CHAD domain-containing protein n=1 Tax=Amycolatopsis sp. NPDC059657 TaxID=3346899 RepID=UPI00366F96C4
MTAVIETKRFDTGSLRLARHGLSVRRSGSGWCLATPDGEIAVASAADEVPPELSSLVLAFTRGEELVAVDGREATADEPRFDGSARGVVLAYLHGQIQEITFADISVRQAEPGSAARMALAVHRVRDVLGAYATVLGGRKLVRLVRRELSWLAACLDALGEAETQWDRLAGRVRALPERFVVGPVEPLVDRYFGSLTRECRARVGESLAGKRYLRLLYGLDLLRMVLIEEPRSARSESVNRPAGEVLPGLVAELDRKATRRIAKAASGTDDREHAMSKAGAATDRLCHAAEVAGMVPSVRPAVVASLREHKAAVAARLHLRAIEAFALGQRLSVFTFGLLYQLETEAFERSIVDMRL